MADIGINVVLSGLAEVGAALADLGRKSIDAVKTVAVEFKSLGQYVSDLKDKFTSFLSQKWDQLWSAIKSGAEGLGLHLGTVAQKLLPMIGILAGAGVLAFGAAKKFANLTNEMKDLAQEFGVTTEQMSRFSYIAKLEGMDVTLLASSFALLGKDIARVQEGGKSGEKMSEKFKKYGITLVDTEGKAKSLEDIMLGVADAIKAAETPAEKLAVATDLLGTRAAKLIPLLAQGGDAIKKAFEESDKIGFTISTESGDQGEEFNKTLAKIQARIEGFSRGALNTGLTPLMGGFDKLLVSLNDVFTSTNLVSSSFAGLLYVFKGLTTGISIIGHALNILGKSFAALFASMAAAGSGNFKEAWSILKFGASDAMEEFKKIMPEIEKVWGDTADKMAKDSDKAAKSMEKLQKKTEAAKEAAKKMAFDGLPQLSDGLMKVSFAINSMSGDSSDGFMKVANNYRGMLNSMSKSRKNDLDKMIEGQDEAFKNLTDEQREGFRRLATAADGFATEFTTSLNSMLWDTERSWKDFFKSLGRFISATLLQEYISIPLSNGIKQMMASLFGNALGNAAAGGGGGGLQPIQGASPGLYAAGGGIIPSGSWALVGEKGPEIMKPAAGSRSVIPNDALGGMGSVTINQHYTAGVTQADLARILPAIRQQTMAAMVDASRRGG